MLQLHVDGLKKEYDSLRAHLTKNPPEEETHIYIYIHNVLMKIFEKAI